MEVVVLAQILTTTHRTGDRARKAAGLAVVGASGTLAAMALAGLGTGTGRAAAVVAAAVCLVFSLVQWVRWQLYRDQAAAELKVFSSLARLPRNWYLLGDLMMETSWLEPVAVWAVVVAPGGLAVIQPFTAKGDVTPYGHVWMVGRGQSAKTVPSPAAAAGTAAEALREILGTAEVPIEPVVVLTDLHSVFHRAETGAQVVGAPHVTVGVERLLSGRGQICDAFQLAAYLSHYHRK